jgi:ABC-2 type transport system permease protein
MRKIWLVVKREYLVRVRTKGFIIGTIALPLFVVVVMLLPVILAKRQPTRTQKIAVLDETGVLAPAFTQDLSEKLPNGQPAFRVARTLNPPASGDVAALRKDLHAEVNTGKLDGYLVLPKDVLGGKSAEFYSKNPTGDLTFLGTLRRAVSDAVIASRLEQHGVRVDKLSELVRGVNVSFIRVTREGEVEEKGQTFLVAIMVAMVLYMTLIVYGVMTMRSVVEEKRTRIVEVLVSSLRPYQLLMGKVLGVAAVGFTQYLIWTICAGLFAGYGAAMASAFSPGASVPKIQLPASMLVYLVVFYLAGYFLYASLYAAAGAMVSSDEDAQQVQMPMTLMIVVSFLLFTVIMHNPNSTLSIVLSEIPFFAPILMILRIAMQTPPFWQIALSLVLAVATTLAILQFSAKIYRVGILMYGKRPSLVELWRWLRYT